MDNRTGEMQVFLRVVEAGSFSEAARLLRMTPSTISKLVARIEARLGVRLLERSTRRFSLTAEGQTYYERSQALLGELDEIERAVSHGATATGGIIRINSSVPFGVHGLEPLLPAFWQDYPHIAVDLSLSDEVVDLYLDRTDIAFRSGRLPSSGMMARRIGTPKRKIVAAPVYLARHGQPQNADDLAKHACLGFNFRRLAPVWPFKQNGRIVERSVRHLLLANNGESVRRLALAGAGLARLAEYHIRDDLAAGHLVEVLADAIESDEEEIHAVYLGGARLPQRVRVFLDFVVPRLQQFLQPG